jgi:two-component system, OmpR family, response regulator
VLTKEEIRANVWGDSAHAGEAAVETYVSYLRRKLDRLGPPLIRTVRLVGYALREPSP